MNSTMSFHDLHDARRAGLSNALEVKDSHLPIEERVQHWVYRMLSLALVRGCFW